MKQNWDKWVQEAVDTLDHRYGRADMTKRVGFERRAWIAWSSGMTALDFADEHIRDTRPEF